MTWVPGQSGNPSGRPRTRLISDAIKDQLRKTRRERGITLTTAQRLIRRMVRIAEYGDDKDAIAAVKFLTAYSEGQPVQPVEFEIADVAEKLSAMTGAPAAHLIKRARELREAMGPVYDAPSGSYERILPTRGQDGERS